MPTTPVPWTHGQRVLAARPEGRAGRRGTAPDTGRPPQRRKATRAEGRPPATPAARRPPQGMQAKGSVLDHHACMAAPTARGQQAPTAHPDGGQPGKDERLTSDAPHNGARHPPAGALSPPPQHATQAPKSARCGAGAGCPMARAPVPRTHGQRALVARPQGQEAGRGTAPDARRPPQRRKATSRDGLHPPSPRHAAPRRACTTKGRCRAPTRALPPTARAADPDSAPRGQAAKGGRAPDLGDPPQQDTTPPSGGALAPAPLHARSRAVAGSPVPRTLPRTHRQRALDARPAPRDGQPEEGRRLTPDASQRR